MGYFGSKATTGLSQALIALMPPHSVYIESHLGGGALMKRKPAAMRSIGIDRDERALEAFGCEYPVELVHGCAHSFLASFPFLGPELVYSDPPICTRPGALRSATASSTRRPIRVRGGRPCRAPRTAQGSALPGDGLGPPVCAL